MDWKRKRSRNLGGVEKPVGDVSPLALRPRTWRLGAAVTWWGLGSGSGTAPALSRHHRTVNNHFIHGGKTAASKLPVSLSQSKHISQLPEMNIPEPVHLPHTTRCERGPRTSEIPADPHRHSKFPCRLPSFIDTADECCTVSSSF